MLLLFFSYSGLQLSWNIGEKRGQKSVPSGKRRVLGVERKVEVFSGPTMSKVQVNPGREGSEWEGWGLVGVRECWCYLPIN